MFAVPAGEGQTAEVKAELDKRFTSHDEVMDFLDRCKKAEFTRHGHSEEAHEAHARAPVHTPPPCSRRPPASSASPWSQTMMVAQHLYENGRITYMRTDSVNLSSLCVNSSKQEITSLWGEEYSKPRQYHTHSKGAQEAHEAIRPTYMADAAIDGTQQEKRLYDLIWKRTAASQMADALLEKTTVTISADGMDEHVHSQRRGCEV